MEYLVSFLKILSGITWKITLNFLHDCSSLVALLRKIIGAAKVGALKQKQLICTQ